ncbi:MAG: VWA domain-containing protein [Acidobacteria bacterium]|nr:VWA domain-containing protein [Acidobacteriota bacterium]
MKKFTPLVLAAILLASLPSAPLRAQGPPSSSPAPRTAATPQQPQPTPAPQDDSDDEVVRITSNLVQFDAVVVDRQGRQVTDLRAEDFEVTLEGDKQQLTNFSYISNVPGPAEERPVVAARPADKNAPPVPPARLRPGQVRRTIALVVDDLGTSFESTHFVRQALKKYVDEQMQPDDLVAIIRTSAGMGALQQFTSDRRQLYAAIERVRWYPGGRSGVSAFTPLEAKLLPDMPNMSGDEEGDREKPSEGVDEFREEVFAVGTLGALNFVVKGMKELPGRKSVVLFSEGFVLFNREDMSLSNRLLEGMRRLTDLANRASVVIYTIDPRGLPTLGLTAADSTSGRSAQEIARALTARSTKYIDTQDAMRYLAQETGGFFVRNTNDLGGGVRRVLDDQKGFYLIGFRPSEETFDPVKGQRRFNRFEVKVKRAGLRVRTRGGFYGFTEDEAARPMRRTRVEQLVGALTSPFASGEVRLRLTSLFGGDAVQGSFLTSLMHIDMSKVKFTEEADGWQKAAIDVIALTYGESGQIVDELNRTETVRARGTALRHLLEDGLVYTMRIPVKKPGAYQLRVAVRDVATEKLGSASQFVEVPDLKKKRLALSGIVLEGAPPASISAPSGSAAAAATATASPAPTPAAQGGASEGQANEPDPLSNAAVRRFRQGMKVDYFLNIYNARLDPASARPQLRTQMRLFRDSQLVFTGRVNPFDPGQQTGAKYMAGSRLQLGSDLPPGDYVLQIIVTDPLVKGKYSTAAQWIDFEIVK